MPTVSGSLISINRSPSTVAGAWVRAKVTRPFEDGLGCSLTVIPIEAK